MVAGDVIGEVRGLMASGVPVHMSGIGGVGMAGLALLLRAKGIAVSGCDLHPGPFSEALRRAGIPVYSGHAVASAADPAGWVIRSAAVRLAQPDLQYALSRGVPIFRRGEVLPALVQSASRSIAVAGTHGKTTTSTLVAQLLHSLQPAWCIGGVSAPYPVPGGDGAGPLVVEADESDGTLAHYTSDVALITNVDFDHMEHFDSVAAFEACFGTFLEKARERVVYCADDARASAVCAAGGNKRLGYGFSADAGVRGVWVGKREMRVLFPDGQETRVDLPASLPGRHNALNLLGALAVCYALDVPEHVWQPAVAGLCLPARRFEVVADRYGMQVVTDYAHHPVEIAAVIRMARELHQGRILAVFQPHRYSRTQALLRDFPAAFCGVDQLVLTPVYAASEMPLAGGNTEDLLRQCESAAGGYATSMVRDLSEAAALVCAEMRAGDLVLVLGAGDVEKVGRMISDVIPSLNGGE